MVLRYCEVAPHWLPGIRAKDQKGEISLSFGSLVNYHMYDFLQRSNLEKHNNSQERFQAGTFMISVLPTVRFRISQEPHSPEGKKEN